MFFLTRQTGTIYQLKTTTMATTTTTTKHFILPDYKERKNCTKT